MAPSRSSSPGSTMSPVWFSLPNELVCMVVERSDRETLFNWAYTSKFYYNVAADLIWRSFRVRNPGRKPYPFDALGPTFPFQSKSPAQRIKNFEFFSALRRGLAISCITNALGQLSNLEHVSLEGHVHPDGFNALIQNKNLRCLSMRQGTEFQPDDGNETSESLCSYTFNFAPLAGIASLADLRVGQLTPAEAPGLAKAIRDLPLVKLTIVAAPPADLDDPRKSYSGTEIDKSPSQTILEITLESPGEIKGTLPPTLQDITLRDRFRPFQSTNKDLLLDVFRPVDVSKLELLVMAPKQLVHFFHHARFHNLTSFTVNGCRHFLPDTAWTALGLDIDKGAPIDPPDIPIYGSFFDFLSRHQQSLKDLTMRPGLLHPGCNYTLRFKKGDLKRLGDLDRTIRTFETPGATSIGYHHKQWVWEAYEWTRSCSQRPTDHRAFLCSCLCMENERCITMATMEPIETSDDEEDEDSEAENYEYDTFQEDCEDSSDDDDDYGDYDPFP
ncbi:MAG: hypothetical protein LQ349_000253 [Xanthoria aureola]|nr:MAG: hypothetical protein LQ349_000253 [Xanthoria aureola]